MNRSCARFLAVCCVFLAVVGVATAKTKKPPVTPKSGVWKATKVQSGYDLKFTVNKKHTAITKIVGHVLESCTGESTSDTTTVAPDASWAIAKNGTFSGRKKEVWGSVTVYFTFQGKFTSATHATGIVREESIVAGSRCDTYKLKWTANAG